MTSVDEKLLKTRRDEREDDEEVPLAIVHVTTPSDEDDGDDDGFGSETEDEEVKMNTITGCRGIDDSDMNTTDDDDELSDDEELEQSERGQGVVEFVKERLASSNLVRPQATSPSSRSKNLSPLEEDNESSDSSASSVGARGVALSLGGSAMSESQVEDDDASDASSIDDEALMEEARNPFQDPGYNAENEDDGDDEDWAEEDDDDEISDLLETLVNRSGESSEHDDSPLAGVAADRDDILITIPKAKRVLSFNTLVALNSEIERIRNDSLSPKRAKHQSGCDVGESHNGLFSGFSLGPSALDEPFPSPMKFRPRESPVISSSDDEELDRQLQDELGDGHRRSRDNSPVPLLTPPESPLTIEIDGDRATFCEWPSNLAVDTAFAAAINDKRSLSPASLDGSSDDEKTDVAASTLTPLLRGISVGR